MKKPKLWRGILIILLIWIVFWCWDEIAIPSSYRYPHSVADAVRVELMRNRNTDVFSSDDSKFVLLTTLEGEQMTAFLCAVRDLETGYCISPPGRGYGDYVARVTYANGDVEYYGARNIEFVENGAERTGVGAYYFRDNALEPLILAYCGRETDNK